MSRRAAVAATTLTVLLAAGAAVVITNVTAAASTRTRAVPARLVTRFRVLREARIATAMPPGLAAEVASGPFNLNPSDARMVAVNSDTNVWVVPGSDGVCVLVPRTALDGGTVYRGGCATTARATAGGLEDRLGPRDGQDLIFGLAPDGSSTETVATPSGGTVTTPVVDNVYAVTVPDNSGG
jgi:hypothetical protein